MAITYYDLVKDTTSTTGTGTISLSSIAAGVGYRTFASCVTSGHTVAYKMTATGGAWEVGTGVVTSGTPWTLTRAAILASSNANAVVNFPSGTKFVSIVHPASLIVKKDGDAFTGTMNFPIGGLVVGSGNTDYSARVTIKAADTSTSTALALRATSADTGSIRFELTPGTNTTSYISDYYVNKASHVRFSRNNSTGDSTIALATGTAFTPVETFAISPLGNISLGVSANAAFHASSTMFPSAVPRVEIKTGFDGATAYDNLLVVRGIATAAAVLRRTGIVLKGSSEGSVGESNKMAAMYIESTSANGNTPSLKFATTNTERMVIDSSGNVAVGTTPATAYKFRVGTALAGSAGPVIGIRCDSVVQSDVTSSAFGFSSSLTTAAAAFTLTDLYHYSTSQSTFGAGSTVTNQTGFLAGANLTGATNNYGFRGAIPSGANRWNLYMDGTASNYINGTLLIGTATTTDANSKLQVNGQARVQSGLTTNSNVALMIGANINDSVITDAVTKIAVIAVPHYNTASNNFSPMQFSSQTSLNDVAIGGGSGNHNASTQVRFFTGATTTTVTGTERMRIDSIGNVGIGTSPNNAYKVHISADSSTGPVSGLLIQDTMAGTGRSFGLYSYNGSLIFRDISGSAQRMAIDSSGNVGIGLSPTARNNTRLQIVDGIGFPPTQVASSDANTLDDYEEGSFTPTIYGTTVAGSGTYSQQVGKYTKIGNVVYFSIYIVVTAHTGTGNIRFGALPFAVGSSTSDQTAISIGFLNNLTIPASSVPMCYAISNSSSLDLISYPLGGGAYSAVAMDTAFSTIVSGHYTV